MSGLLVAYLAFIELEKKRFNLVMFYVLRYVRWIQQPNLLCNYFEEKLNYRLTIPLALVIGFNLHLKDYFFVEGPLSWKNLYHEGGCEDGWWPTLLYISNLTEDFCLGQTWYLMCDMQLFFCSPLILLPMYYWQKNNNGLKLWLLVITFFSLVPMSITLIHNLAPGHGQGIPYGILST